MPTFLLLVGLLLGVVSAQYLYNLDNDPYEEQNVVGRNGNADVVANLTARFNELADCCVGEPVDNPDGAARAVYNAEGGYVPWFNFDNMPEKNHTHGDAVIDNPPNIVFIMVDDWGWNDVGWRSSNLNWTTPNVDDLASRGIKLENYHTHWVCAPSRGALLTGRYAFRLGMGNGGSNLPLDESTMAQELNAVGYDSTLIGKWHLGGFAWEHTPTFRGFDRYYGYLNGFLDYYNKTTQTAGNYFDLHDQEDLVTNATEVDPSFHLTHLLQSKVTQAIREHADADTGRPMFLYYAMQNVHLPLQAPDEYVQLCSDIDDPQTEDFAKYCALNVMADEAIGETYCELERAGMADNTIFVVSSDNGGSGQIPGNTWPLRGNKGGVFQGGVKGTSFMVAPGYMPETVQGTEYNGLAHIADWLPTFMNFATNGTWTGPMSGHELDGMDLRPALFGEPDAEERNEIIHNIWFEDVTNTADNTTETVSYGSLQVDEYKMVFLDRLNGFSTPVDFPKAPAGFPMNYVCNVDSEDYVYGCTDTSADNFNPNAVLDDGSCQYFSCDPDSPEVHIPTHIIAKYFPNKDFAAAGVCIDYSLLKKEIEQVDDTDKVARRSRERRHKHHPSQ